jgi:hypothetical protein
MMTFRVGVRFLLLALGGAVLAGCSSPTPQSFCDRVVARERRCNADGGRPACEIDDHGSRCAIETRSFRSDYLAALNDCPFAEASCGSEGETTLWRCQRNALRQLPLTAAYRNMVDALCGRCPTHLGGTDTASCVDMLTHLPSNDHALLFNFLSGVITKADSTLQSVTACITADLRPNQSECDVVGECMQGLNSFVDNTPPSSHCSADGGM